MSQIRNVVFVTPFIGETTLLLLHAVTKLPNARVGIVTQDSADKLQPKLREALSGHYQIERGLDPDQIERGVRALGSRFGSVDRLLGTLEELQVPLAEVRDRLGIEGLGAEAARNFRDKARMKAVLQAADLPCARHELATAREEACAFAARVGFPIIVKPTAGSGARGTFRLESNAQLEQCLSVLPPGPEQPIYLEEFVTGTEHSFDSVALNGQIIWHSISHYAPSPLEVLREPWIQWCVLIPREVDRPEYGAIREVAARAIPVLGLKNGLSHMEWFQRPDGGVAISEVGARPPGAQFTKLISYAHDFDLYAAWARLMVFDQFEPRPRPFAAGAAYLRGQGRGRVHAITGLKDVLADLGPIVMEQRLPAFGQPPSGTYEGDGLVILRHHETSVVEAGLRRIVDTVRVWLG